jgi:hypothetical protein
MTNTIELLERIGRDAALRHASKDDLARTLGDLQASDGLRQAVMSGHSDRLAAELGPRETQQPQTPIHIAPPGGEDEEESGTTEERQGGNAPDSGQ